jgi:hypothetical protein
MNCSFTVLFVHLFLIFIIPSQSISLATINKAVFATGVPFSTTIVGTFNVCVCQCIFSPHCLTVGIAKTSTTNLTCLLFATYPSMSTQLSSSTQSNVTVLVDRVVSSVYTNNFTRFSNSSQIFSPSSFPWIPVLQLITGNNQSFLWFDSINSTTWTTIPSLTINSTNSQHWFSILISQWTQNLFTPRQVALVFIVNHSIIFDVLIFNVLQSNITTWFNSSLLVSTRYWSILQYQSTSTAQIQMKSVYIDSDCTRSFNANYKSASSHCAVDFYGYFFVNGGYSDVCLAAVTNAPTARVPSVFYSPATTYTPGNFSAYRIADGLMVFVQ